MLDRLEVFNFKSYKGKRVIGPFKPFTCVIGPNGSGKSNLMDAISFVLGVRSAQLRSNQLKDLIYRAGQRPDADGDMMDVDEQEDSETEQEEEEAGPSIKKAWVAAVYIDSGGVEWRYQRTISSSGSSEYRVNGRAMAFAKYNESLEKHNILVKAKNFLVFQGDVEAVAQQQAMELSELIERISGSLELKEEYDEAFQAQEAASKASNANYQTRKVINSEIKQFKEQKDEVQRYEKLKKQLDDAIVQEALWKLFHIEKGLDERRTLVEQKNDAVRGLREEQTTHEGKLSKARQGQVKAQKAVSKHEKQVKGKQKELEDKRPDLVAIETQIAHTAKKLKGIQQKETAVTRERTERQTSLKSLEKDLVDTEKAVKQIEAEHRKASKARGLALSEDDLADYRDLRAQAANKAVDERSIVESKSREARSLRDNIAALDDKLEQLRYKQKKRAGEEAELKERTKNCKEKSEALTRDLAAARKAFNDAQTERTAFVQRQSEMDSKLRDIVTKLLALSADERESEREKKLKEAIEVLKRTIPGVFGRVSELCTASQNKYATAITMVLGRNLDAVVVDTEETALQCIQSMRDQRSGTATFIPLDTIQVKPIDDKFRSFKGARLAIDVMSFHTKYEKALHYVCGSTIICDDLPTARSICYDRRTEVKAVTLDGTTIHKSGQMSGGAATGGRTIGSSNNNEAEALRKAEESVRQKLAEHAKKRPRHSADEQHQSNIARIETELSLVKDDLSAGSTRLKSATDELTHVAKDIDKYQKQHDTASAKLEALEQEIEAARDVIDGEEADIFADFCTRIGVENIREYEEKQLEFAEAEGSSKLKADKTLARLKHQVAFEKEQLEGFDAQLANLAKSIANSQDSLKKLEEDKNGVQKELESLEAEIAELIEGQEQLKEDLEEASAEVDKVKKSNSKSAASFQKALKEISSWNDEIEKLAADRFAVFRRCRLEEIRLPLSAGSLRNVPLEEAGNDNMDVDNEDSTQRPAEVADYDIEVNFASLEDEDRDEDSDEHGATLAEAIRKLAADLQRMAPNMKAIDKLDETEAKLKATDKDHDKARREAKQAKETFDDIKNRRIQLFRAAYDHISERIDQIYKELTKGKSAPMGGVAYLSLGDEGDEPYLAGVKYHAMPPMKRFRDMEQLSGGEKTMAALALLFAIHSFKPSPFFVLDEVDAALDNTNVGRIAHYINQKANEDFQFIVISLKPTFYQNSHGLVGVWRDVDGGSSDTLTLDLQKYSKE